MNPNVRKLIFEPLVTGRLHAMIPDFTIESSDNPIIVPASLTCPDNDSFQFTLYFQHHEIPEVFARSHHRILTTGDRIRISGTVDGEIGFWTSVFPGGQKVIRSEGISTVTIQTEKLNLSAMGTDLLTHAELSKQYGLRSDDESAFRQDTFEAHLIFKGPKLGLRDSGTRVVTHNGFLGESVSASLDTHTFSGDGWEAALIQNQSELHLHIRNQATSLAQIDDPELLVDQISAAVAFTHGFMPWPIYHELRINHRVTNRWLAARCNLEQSWLAPLNSNLCNRTAEKDNFQNTAMIPSIAEGFRRFPVEKYKQLKHLLWNVIAADLGELPSKTKILIICAALDGLMKVIGRDRGSGHTMDEWQEAAKITGISWNWLSEIMDTRKKHRDDLSHGRLWMLGNNADNSFFTDYPSLGCAFMIMIAAWAGYSGLINENPMGQKILKIDDLKQNRLSS